MLIKDPLMKVLKQDLTIASAAQLNGDVEVNDGKISNQSMKMQQKWMACQNAVMIVSRMPLESISLHRKSGIFRKFLLLDQAVVSEDTNILLKKSGRMKLLMVIRRTLTRHVISMIKIMIEVSHAVISPNFKGNGFIDTLFGFYRSLNKFSSDELQSITMVLGETSIR